MSRRSRRRERNRRLRRWLLWLLLAATGFLLVAFLKPAWFLEAEYARLGWQAGTRTVEERAAEHRLARLEAGDGPMIVLLHGFTGSKENWLPVIGPLAAAHRVVAVDLPGWGASERLDGADYGFAAQAQRISEILRRLGAENSPVVLVGHSMGGGGAALVAARTPQLVERLVLVDAAGVRFDDNDFSRAVARGEHPFEVSDRATLDRQLNLVFDRLPWVPWPADRALIAQRVADQPFERDVLQRIARSDEAVMPGEEARAIRAPTLLLWCRNDRIIDVSAAARYAERIAGSQTVLLDRCNHMPMMEQPMATADAILRFIKG